MKKEADLYILLRISNFFTQHFWEEHKVIIMNPDKVSILYILCHGLCKKTVDLLVCSPSRLVECDFSRVVVKQRPKDRIWYSLAVHIRSWDLLILEKPL